MLRRLAACSIAAVIATAVLGAAASLGVSGDAVVAGSGAASLDCSAGTTVSYTYSGANVSQVTVNGLPVACQDGKVWLALTGATGAKVSEAAPVTATGASASLDVTDVDAALVKGYSIAVVR
jgi:hypothetical protein